MDRRSLPEVFASVLGVAAGYPWLTVLDSTHPDKIGAVPESIEPGRTIFIVSSKSGGTLETISGFRFFWEADRRQRRGVSSPSPTPAAPSSSWEGIGDFGRWSRLPPDVGGRFSALTPFGLLPAAMIGADLTALLEAAAAVSWESASTWGSPGRSWPQEGRDKLTFVTSPALAAFPGWLEQLVAESLGKDGKGHRSGRR